LIDITETIPAAMLRTLNNQSPTPALRPWNISVMMERTAKRKPTPPAIRAT